MELFKFGKKEEYSKEAYDKAVKEKNLAHEKTPGAGEFASEGALHARLQEDYNQREKADKKVDKLFESGRKEATELNKEYEARKQEIEKMLNEIVLKIGDLEDFEFRKLGMADTADLDGNAKSKAIKLIDEIHKYREII